MSPRRRGSVLAIISLFVATACGGSPATVAPTATVAPAATIAPTATVAATATAVLTAAVAATPDRPIDGTFDIGGRWLYLRCQGTGEPTIVFDAGLGNDSTTWAQLLRSIPKTPRVCVYDRAGLGKSVGTGTVRTSADVVVDLRALLAKAGVPPPFVLVGHSFGGTNIRLFAEEHPVEVVGLVLVDPMPAPGYFAQACLILSTSDCAKLDGTPQSNPEGLDLTKSDAELQAAGPLPNVPLVLLEATQHDCDLATPAACSQLDGVAQKLQATTAASVPGGRLVIATGSSHYIHQDDPSLVAQAIVQVVEQAGGR